MSMCTSVAIVTTALIDNTIRPALFFCPFSTATPTLARNVKFCVYKLYSIDKRSSRVPWTRAIAPWALVEPIAPTPRSRAATPRVTE
jgi:hypothetical protein